MTSSFVGSRTVRPSLLSVLILSAAVSPLALLPVQAVAASLVQYQQGPMPLAQALLLISRKSGVTVVFDPALVQGFRAASVNGKLTSEEALRAALRDTGLELQRMVNGSYTLSREVRPAGMSRDDSGGTTLEAMVVNGTRERGYSTESSRSATRTDTSLLELSQSVSSVTRELIDDQQATSVYDALRNVSSVTMGDGAPGASPTVNVRGFAVENAMTDGLASSGPFAFQTPTIAVERIDVIKGPESVLGGTTSKFGGAINLVTKRPEARTFRQLQSTIDSNGRKQLGLDVTGALIESKSLTGRLVLSGDEQGDTDLGVHGAKDYYISPSLGWQDELNTLVVGFEAQNLSRPIGSYAYFMGNNITQDYIPIYRSRDNAIDYKRRRAHFDYALDLGNDWKFGLRGQYVDQKASGDYWLQTNLAFPISSSPLVVYGNSQEIQYRSHTVQADLGKELNLGFSKHRLLVGFDYLASYNESSTQMRYADPSMPFSLFPSGTSAILPSVSDLEYANTMGYSESEYHERGILFQDQITLWDRLHVKLALRRIEFEAGLNSPQPALSKNMPSVGIAYQYTPTASVYASYSEGIERPSALLTRSGQPLPPTEAESQEVGLKNTFFDERLVLTAALFDIRKSNLAEADFDNPTTYHSVGGARYRGFELEVNGKVTSALSITAAYTNTRAVTDSGNRSPSDVRQAANLWGVYRFQGDWLGWNIGGGIVARSATYQDVPAFNFTTRNPGNARIDLTGGYETSDWSLRLGVRNLANRTLFSPGSTIQYASLEPERVVTLSAVVNF